MRSFALAGTWVVLLSVALPACKRPPPAAPGGSIILSVDSNRRVERVKLVAYEPYGGSSELFFATDGKDLTKEPVSGEVVPGLAIGGGRVLFVGIGYVGEERVASGRVEATFASGARTAATLTLKGEVIDVDEDGYELREDCNDRSSGQSPFHIETCDNNVDDDCDGSPDEACACAEGQRRDCYSGAEQTRHRGQCRDGAQLCAGGVWSSCSGSVLPGDETCNGKDDNCEGSVDEDCSCPDGTQRYCWGAEFTTTTGSPANLSGVRGECRAGVQRCVASKWAICEGAVFALAETCDGKDNDCDDEFDEDFDQDQDGYTTCGTNNGAACTSGAAGGLNGAVADCDDHDAERTPCGSVTPELCGDNDKDNNCDSSVFECTATGTCASAGFMAGWDQTSGPGEPVCRRLGGSYGMVCDPSTRRSCTIMAAADCVAGNGPSTEAAASPRTSCHGVAGCLVGTTTGPAVGGPLASGDKFGDCDGRSCNNAADEVVYANVGNGQGTGWEYRAITPTSGFYECRVRQDASDADVDCASGACETTRVACLRKPTAAASVANMPNAALGACLVPQGRVDDNNLGTTCFTNAGTSTPPQSTALSGVLDPHNRCPEGGLCDDRVKTPWQDDQPSAGQARCVIFNSNGDQLRCAGGACGDPTASPAAAAAACADVLGVVSSVCADKNCKIAARCDQAGEPLTSPYCFDANDPTNKGGSCAAGESCYSGVTNLAPSSICTACTNDDICGPTCATCGDGACCAGRTGDSAACDRTGVTVAADARCMCGLVPNGIAGNRTTAMFCPGSGTNGCCGGGERCSGGTACVAVAATEIACGGSVCAKASQWCKVDAISGAPSPALAAPFTCVTVTGTEIACHQKTCIKASEACTSNPGSVCTDCVALNRAACGDQCCPNATDYCSNVGSGACSACSGARDEPCNQDCCLASQREYCSDFGASTCTQCSTNRAPCGDKCCGPGDFCSNTGAGTCSSTCAGQACNQVCCSGGTPTCTSWDNSTCGV